jgi:polysaccharide export outer membrane protein
MKDEARGRMAEKGFSPADFSANMLGRKLEKEPMKIKSLAHHLAGWSITFSIFAAAVSFFLAGCGSTKSHSGTDFPAPNSMMSSNDVVLKEADHLKIVFPGASQLDTDPIIRRDGKIGLPIVGEIKAAGKTPAELKNELGELYAKELVSSKDIAVLVLSASFPVYVTGAVGKSGKIMTDHPLTVLEAIMEAGGFDDKSANLSAVTVIRTQNGKTQNFKVNLKGVVSPGKPVDIFYLQPGDIIHVPSRMIWF